VEFVGEMPVSIQSDPTRLRQVLLNLVGNAIKFTDTGEVRLVASLEQTEDHSALLQIQVIDTGIGMSEELVGRLFNPFTQADSSTSRRFGGTGLGLTISQRLAHLLGGSISVRSTVGEGSVFTVRVPTGSLDGVGVSESPREAEFQPREVKPQQAGEGGVLQGCRVLLAEDGPDNQRLIAFLLKTAGAEVIVADDGRIAVDAAMKAQREGKPFDVVLMDIQMPFMDGYEATKKLRAEGWSTPIIALTAHALKEDRQKCLDAGCDDYAAKPIDRQTLVNTVARWAARARADFRGVTGLSPAIRLSAPAQSSSTS
jgi:Amt family ammonium transporter